MKIRFLIPFLAAGLGAATMPAGTITGKMPTEIELAEQYGVGRITVRRAMAILESEGLVSVVHGRGTFAKPPG